MKPLIANFAEICLGWSFTKCVFSFCVNRKCIMASAIIDSFNIGSHGKMKNKISQKL
jgi:hypothetical protein